MGSVISPSVPSREVTTVNRKPKAEPNGYRMLPKALDLLHFEPECHRMQ